MIAAQPLRALRLRSRLVALATLRANGFRRAPFLALHHQVDTHGFPSSQNLQGFVAQLPA
jgi:hypothetical protein